ncbi:hypothetical protein DY000_02023952 [Brassica cretica]|uniref:Uncharacterized protein n=1 Tax=Brassica cretica TaxID=69181 RepID=A0ABQ7EM16_BRACR|nr:hypothetical protein DY000_02023952 [Brassica cretica]
MRYWVLGLVPSPGKALPGEVDRCLTGPRGMIHVRVFSRASLTRLRTSNNRPWRRNSVCRPETSTLGVVYAAAQLSRPVVSKLRVPRLQRVRIKLYLFGVLCSGPWTSGLVSHTSLSDFPLLTPHLPPFRLRDWLWSGPMKLLLQHVRWFLLSLKVVPLALAKLLLINLPLVSVFCLCNGHDDPEEGEAFSVVSFVVVVVVFSVYDLGNMATLFKFEDRVELFDGSLVFDSL